MFVLLYTQKNGGDRRIETGTKTESEEKINVLNSEIMQKFKFKDWKNEKLYYYDFTRQ